MVYSEMPFCFANSEPILFLDNIIISFPLGMYGISLFPSCW